MRTKSSTGETDYATLLASSVEIRAELLESEHPGESFSALRSLPHLYRLLWRLAFDMQLSPPVRHYAAAIAFYICSRLDYLPEDSRGTLGYLDDLAAGVGGIRKIRAEIKEEIITGHWRGPEPLDCVLTASERLIVLYLPKLVEEMVTAYIER